MIARAATTQHFRRDAADGGNLRTVTRLDRGEALLPSSTTPEGYLLCEARMAKPGVLIYTNADGSQRRELIRADELSAPTSLATMGRKPVTIEHPSAPVDKNNVAELGVGDVDGEVVYDDGYVKVRLCVRRADALIAIGNGKQEVSPGYAVDLDETPGVDPTFGAYDAIQLRRRYNHLALTDAARGGVTIRLRADGSAVDRSTSEASMNPKLIALLLKLGLTNIRKDAEDAMLDEGTAKVTDLIGQEANVTIVTTQLGAASAKVAELEAALAVARTELAAASPADPGVAVDAAMEMDPPAPEAVVAPEDGKPMSEPARMDSIRKAVTRQINERVRLDSLAMGLGLDGKDVAKLGNKSLRKAIIAKANPNARADAADDYYRAAIDMLPPPSPGVRTDAAEPADPYAGFNAAFRKNVEGAGDGKGRADAADPLAIPDVDGAWKAQADAAFKARHGIDNRTAAK